MTVPAKKEKSPIKTALDNRKRHRIPILAAGLSYYALLSVTPIIIVIASVVDWLGPKLPYFRSPEFYDVVAQYAGSGLEDHIQEVTAEQGTDFSTTFVAILAFIVVLWSASVFFTRLKDSLDMIWDVTPQDQEKKMSKHIQKGFAHIFDDHTPQWILKTLELILSSFVWLFRKTVGIISVISMLFVGIIVIILNAVFLKIVSTLTASNVFYSIGFWLFPFILFSIMLTGLYLWVPAVKVAWAAAWKGATATAFVLSFAIWFIGNGFGAFIPNSMAAVSSGVLLFMLLAYFSMQIVLTGAELVRALEIQAAGSSD